jgi:transcriptional regulator with XRE-family HTH domain
MANRKRSSFKIISDEQRILRYLRLEKGWSLAEASEYLGIKSKALGHIENGRVKLESSRVKQIIEAWGYSNLDYQRAKRILPKESDLKKRKTISVMTNSDRRSYRRIITKEVRVLKVLRMIKNLTQDQASSVCGYSRPSIGHIENGRIELSLDRIQHIVSSYGFEMNEFHRLMKEEILRDEVIEKAFEKLKGLSEDKLKLVSNLLFTL